MLFSAHVAFVSMTGTWKGLRFFDYHLCLVWFQRITIWRDHTNSIRTINTCLIDVWIKTLQKLLNCVHIQLQLLRRLIFLRLNPIHLLLMVLLPSFLLHLSNIQCNNSVITTLLLCLNYFTITLSYNNKLCNCVIGSLKTGTLRRRLFNKLDGPKFGYHAICVLMHHQIRLTHSWCCGVMAWGHKDFL